MYSGLARRSNRREIYMKGEQITDILHSFDRDPTIPGMMAGRTEIG
jgi:hypothetical protein